MEKIMDTCLGSGEEKGVLAAGEWRRNERLSRWGLKTTLVAGERRQH